MDDKANSHANENAGRATARATGWDVSYLPSFLASLTSKAPVRGSTHTFYRYPARFSPEFARHAVRAFSQSGDVVLDPFMGGGTSAVEALGEGRRFIGTDINRLACFVSAVKTTLLSTADEAAIIAWAASLEQRIDLYKPVNGDATWEHCQRALPWWLRRLFGQALATLHGLPPRQQAFARCTLLSAAQWALDCKSSVPGAREVLDHHQLRVGEMLHGLQEFAARLQLHAGSRKISPKTKRLICADARALASHPRVKSFGQPKLILTSPPYLGVHVLYHRWQILGRKETAAPYWLANQADGHTGKFYTFADRKAASPAKYLETLKCCFEAIVQVANDKTMVVQLVAFRDPEIQLPLYLGALESAGLQRCDVLAGGAAPLTRQVPNRKWYANLGVQSSSSTEFLIVHRRARKARGG